MDLRLLNLVLVLLRNSAGLTSYEIQEQVQEYRRMPEELFRRNLLRDLVRLNDLGVEVNRVSLGREEGHGKKYYIC
jgi:predicted DNA-binding transcriptional regulator YafY